MQPNLHLGARLVKLISPFSGPAAKEEAFSHLSAALERDGYEEAKTIYSFAKSLGAFMPNHPRRRSNALQTTLECAEGGNAIRQFRTQILSEMLKAHVPPPLKRDFASVLPFPSRDSFFS